MGLFRRRPEDDFFRDLAARRFHALRCGWPDGLILDPHGDPIMAVEFKGPGDVLRPGQERMHQALTQLGLRVEVVRADESGAIPLFLARLHDRHGDTGPRRRPPVDEAATHAAFSTWADSLAPRYEETHP